jgi:hypothetical protein
MAESGLTLYYADLEDAVALLGHGVVYSSLSTDDKAVADMLVKDGLRRWYQPPRLPGEDAAHRWSFLWPTATLPILAPYSTGTLTVTAGAVVGAGVTWSTLQGITNAAVNTGWKFRINGVDYDVVETASSFPTSATATLSDTSVAIDAGTEYVLHKDDYQLPEEFGQFSGKLTYAPQNNAWHTLEEADEGRIRQLRQQDSLAAGTHPWLYALRQRRNDPTVGTRSEILLWPGVQAAATVTYKFHVRPDVLTSTNKYPWGASDHSQTIKAAVLAEAEKWYDEIPNGPFDARFLQNLAASIDFDRTNNGPADLGDYGGRRSRRSLPRHGLNTTPIEYVP